MLTGPRGVARLGDRARAEVDADRDAAQLARQQQCGGPAATRDVDDALAGRDARELRESPRQPLAAGVQLIVEQPAHGIALVEPRAAAFRVGFEIERREVRERPVHAVTSAARPARTCAR